MNLMMNDLFPAAAQPAAKAQHILKVAAEIADHINDGSTVDRSALSELMTGQFGATDASGAWGMHDAYDALEAAQVLAIWRLADPSRIIGTPSGIDSIDAMLKRMPTQTYRSENQIALQQFSPRSPWPRSQRRPRGCARTMSCSNGRRGRACSLAGPN
jgi:hypothetical protein